MALTVRINSLAGFVCTVSVRTPGLVSELKHVIAESTGIPVEAQRILEDTKELHDENVLPSTCPDLTLVQRPALQACWLKKISAFPTELRRAPQSIKADVDVVTRAVSSNGRMLQYAVPELRNDPQIVHAAVRENGSALEFASKELRQNHEIVLTAVRQNGISLQFADEDLTSNIPIVLEAVRTSGLALQYTADISEVRGNPAITLAAVSKDIAAIDHLPPAYDSDNLEALLNAAGIQQDLIRSIMVARCPLDPHSSDPLVRSQQRKTELKVFLRACRVACRACKRASEVAETQRDGTTSHYAQVQSLQRQTAALRAGIQLHRIQVPALEAYTAAMANELQVLRAQNSASRAELPWPVRGMLATRDLMRSGSSCPSRCRSRSRRRCQLFDSDSDEELPI